MANTGFCFVKVWKARRFILAQIGIDKRYQEYEAERTISTQTEGEDR